MSNPATTGRLDETEARVAVLEVTVRGLSERLAALEIFEGFVTELLVVWRQWEMTGRPVKPDGHAPLAFVELMRRLEAASEGDE